MATGCFCALAIVKNASVNMGRCKYLCKLMFFVSFGYVPRSGISRSYGGSI